jgi:alkanesulfonate monooxygenase SsuD/methylene tetrahydromethanopterin reductase-like flavin-dependent oxidoreductase (luciferase family)
MRLGIVLSLFGGPAQGPRPTLRWETIRDRAVAAEAAGADIVVLDDAFLYRDEDESVSYWEATTMAAAVAVATTRIGIGHSVLNGPYRQPTLVAVAAETLDEISGGRYTLGIGRGNVPDLDYAAVGVSGEHRTQRFEEALRIIHGLLKEGRVDFAGEHWSARGAELVMRGPRPTGPPIVVGARGPRMLRLTARYADGWNWWTGDLRQLDDLRGAVQDLERACEAESRDPATLERSIDVYSLDPLNLAPEREDLVRGDAREIAGRLLSLGELGIAEVRCHLYAPPTSGGPSLEAISAMGEVAALLHAA